MTFIAKKEKKTIVEEEEKEENFEDKKLPDISIDEYMKNFKESEFKESELSSLFDDDLFPNIPL